MIVIAIIAIITAFAAGGGIRSWLVQRGLSTAVEQVRSDLQRAKLLAIKEHGNCSITLNTTKQYTISLNGQVVDLSNYRGNVTINLGASTSPITFTPWGTCNAGSIELTNQGNTATYRLRTSMAGAVIKQVLAGANWVSTGI